MTLVNAENDAVVSSRDLKRAKSLLEDYLRRNTIHPKIQEMFLPRPEGFKCRLVKNRAEREGVIYDSQYRDR
jgi:hypothetical protein